MTQLEIMPQPDDVRPTGQPWPTYPMLFRVSSAHEEGGERRLLRLDPGVPAATRTGNVRALRLVDVEMKDGRFSEVEGSEREIPAELVLFAMGFTGPERDGVIAQLEVRPRRPRATSRRDDAYMSSLPGVFVAGDAGRGPVVDRVGDRRGTCGRGRRRHLPDRLDDAAGPDPADRASPRRLSGSHLGTIQVRSRVTGR